MKSSDARRGLRSSQRFGGYLLSSRYGRRLAFRESVVKFARLWHRDRWRVSPARVGSRVNRIPIERPIFVLGLQGGGTTLISRCLRRHPEVISMSGNHNHWTGIDEWGVVRNRMARLPRSLWGSSHRDDLTHPVFGTRHASVFASDELLPSYRLTASDAMPSDGALLSRRIREHLAVYAADRSRARFLDKTHTAIVKLGFLAEMLADYDPVFIVVVRDPFVWCERALRNKPPDLLRPLARSAQLELVAQHWHNCFEAAIDDADHVPGVTFVRFEDFLEAPRTTIAGVASACGLDLQEQMVPQHGHVMPWPTLATDRKWWPLDDNGSAKPRLEPAEASIVAERCGSLAEWFGYADGSQVPRLGVASEAG